MKFFKKTGFIFLSFTFGVFLSFGVTAQQQDPQQPVEKDYSEQELKTFIEANKEVAQIQNVAEQEMITAIEEHNLDVKVFNQILMAKQNPDAEPEASQEQLDKFDKAIGDVMQIQQKTENKMQTAIQDAGMKVEEYQQIMMAYQQSPEMQQRINEMIGKENQGQGN